MIADWHAHIADARVWHRRHQLMKASRKKGLAFLLPNAAEHSDWERLRLFHQEYKVPFAIGIHPFHCREWNDDLKAELLLALENKEAHIVAIGEIGLDFWNGREDRQLQEKAFAEQLELAVKFNMPVCLHNRKSWDAFFGILKELKSPELKGYCHNFTASREVARKVLDAGLHLSFCSTLNYDNADRLRECAKFAPLNRILCETDCPDMPPPQAQASEPWHAKFVLDTLATLHGITPEQMFAAMMANAPIAIGSV